MFQKLMDWCSKVTRLQVRTNADTPEQAANAIAFGATGIGLCRTEHMFFDGNRIDAMREMILADNVGRTQERRWPRLLPYQQRRFRRHFPRTERPARHHPLPGSAVARIPAARRTRRRRIWRPKWACRSRRSNSASRNCTSSTPCSASAAAASASSIRKSPRCRSRAIIEAAARGAEARASR